VDQPHGPTVGNAGLFGSTEAAQQLTSRRVQIEVIIEGKAIDDAEARLGTMVLSASQTAPRTDRRGHHVT
ncbi:MAG: hypothetical protein ACR2MC_08965, partial [Actinomycetota bacterium]